MARAAGGECFPFHHLTFPPPLSFIYKPVCISTRVLLLLFFRVSPHPAAAQWQMAGCVLGRLPGSAQCTRGAEAFVFAVIFSLAFGDAPGGGEPHSNLLWLHRNGMN